MPAALERRDPHQLDEARLRDRVRAEPRPRLERVLRRDVHQAASDPLLAQQRDGPAREQEVRGEVHLQAPLPHGRVELLDPAGGGDAGVEDDGVEASEGRHGGVHGAVDDSGVGEVARDRDRAVELLEPFLVDVREDEMGSAGRQVASDLAADSRSRARDEDDVAGQLRRRRKQRQLAELERPGLEVLDLLVRQPARPSEPVERGGNRSVGVGRDLGARPRGADVGPGRNPAEAPDEEHPAVHLPALEADDGAARPDPQHVIRRASHRADPVGIRPVGQRTLRAVGREDHSLPGGEPAAQPDEEALDGTAVPLRPVGSGRGRAEVIPRPADQLERELVGLLVRLAPGDEAVVGKHDGPSAGELRDSLRELEPGPKIRHDDDIRAERLVDGRLGIGSVRERADRVGVHVVDVRRRQEGVQEGLDRRPRRLGVDEAACEVRDHLVVGHRLPLAQGQQVVEPQPREIGGCAGREVGAASLDAERAPLAAAVVALDELGRRVAAAVQDERGIGADQPRARDETIELRRTFDHTTMSSRSS